MSLLDIETTTHTYKVAGGLSLTLDVSVTKGFNKETGAALLHFHGGFLVSRNLFSKDT